MKKKCCCGCSIAWQDNFSVDHLGMYDTTGTWTRTSNMLQGTSGSKIIGPGLGVTYFEVAMPAYSSTGGFGNSDELKMIIRYVDSDNYIYGRIKNTGPSTGFPPVHTETDFEIWQVVGGVATRMMNQDWSNDAGPYQFNFASKIAITDRKGVISLGFAVTNNSDTTTHWFGTSGQYSYNRSSFSGLTISCFIAGTPAACGIEIVSSAANLRFDDWFSGKGKDDLVYGEDNGCYRMLSRDNMNWQTPESYTFDSMIINDLPVAFNPVVKAYWDLAELTADGGDAAYFPAESPTFWINKEITDASGPTLSLQIMNTVDGYKWELTTWEPTGSYQWYYSDQILPFDPTAGDITFQLSTDGTIGPSWNGSNTLPMPATLSLTIIH
jgi:hypothetical protein